MLSKRYESTEVGLPRGHVFPVKNYENETDLDTNINILVLRALKQLLVINLIRFS